MSDQNGAKPPFDPSQLTPNDLRRLRVALDGRNPQELLGGGVLEDVFQAMTLAHKLRDDPSFTWEAAGDVPPGEMFDMSGGESPPPPTPPPAPSGSTPRPSGGGSRRKRPTGSASAPSSAPTTASPAPSTTP